MDHGEDILFISVLGNGQGQELSDNQGIPRLTMQGCFARKQLPVIGGFQVPTVPPPLLVFLHP